MQKTVDLATYNKFDFSKYYKEIKHLNNSSL